MIIHKSFKHGWFYHYRIHIPKTDVLCNNGLSELRSYLLDVMIISRRAQEAQD